MSRPNIAEIRRRQIIEAAIRVMAEKGWNETSIDEITREAGVSRGLVSYHFRDKSELLSGVLARCQEMFNDAISQAIAQTDDKVQQARLALRHAIDYTVEDPTVYQVFVYFAANGRSNPELGDQIRALWGNFREIAAAGIRRGQARGIYRNDIDPDAAAARQIGAITGLAVQWIVDPGAFPFVEAARQCEDMLIEYLTSGPRSDAPVSGREPSTASA